MITEDRESLAVNVEEEYVKKYPGNWAIFCENDLLSLDPDAGRAWKQAGISYSYLNGKELTKEEKNRTFSAVYFDG